VARTLRNWARQGARLAGVSFRPMDVNGQPGVVLLDGEGRVFSVMSLDIAGGQVRAVNSIVNPEKLGHIGPTSDIGALLAARRDS
jgi:RNA polymerase sigma-70 factor (ECF subfamily)